MSTQHLMKAPVSRHQTRSTRLRWPDRLDPTMPPKWELTPAEYLRRPNHGTTFVSGRYTLTHYLRAAYGKREEG